MKFLKIIWSLITNMFVYSGTISSVIDDVFDDGKDLDGDGVNDIDTYKECWLNILSANDLGDSKEFGNAVRQLLSLPSIDRVLNVTESRIDNEMIEYARLAAQDQNIIDVAFRVLRNDWRIDILPNRAKGFIERVKSILPFANTENVLTINGVPTVHGLGAPTVRDEETEMGVIEIVSIVSILMQVIPRVRDIIKKRREGKQ